MAYIKVAYLLSPPIVHDTLLIEESTINEYPNCIACPDWVKQGDVWKDTHFEQAQVNFMASTEDFQAAVQQHLDAKAQERRYDDIKSAALRAAYPGPFYAEGLAYAQWMDACWMHCYVVLATVQAGQRPMPTAEELLAELPTLTLPA